MKKNRCANDAIEGVSRLNSVRRNSDHYRVNDIQPPQPPRATSPDSAKTSTARSSGAGTWDLSPRNAVLALGFVVLVLGALADIAHFVDGHDAAGAPTTVLLEQDSAGPPQTPIIEVTGTAVPPPLVAPTSEPGTFFDPVFNTHTVEPGDVLYTIANRYGTTTQTLIELNNLEDPNRIEVGQVLALPEPATQS